MKYGVCMCCGKEMEFIGENEKGLCAECTVFEEESNKKMIQDYMKNESFYKELENEWIKDGGNVSECFDVRKEE